MKDTKKTFFVNGEFSVSATQKLTGSLSLDGKNTILHLWGKKIEDIDALNGATITGILENQKKVSLIDCIVTWERLFVCNDDFCSYKLFPKYVVIGGRHHSPTEKTVKKISFVIDDAMALFYDRAAFKSVILSPDHINDIKSTKLFEEVQFEGQYPFLVYWTGKAQIFTADTPIGKISARHRPSLKSSSRTPAPHFSSRIVIFVEFSEAINVREADREIRTVLRFFNIMLGRPQNLEELQIIGSGSCSSDLYLNMYPKYSRNSSIREPDFRNVLVDGASDQENFSQLMCAWLLKEGAWYVARSSFFAGWSNVGSYDPDRLVRAANMFDLLPDDAVPSDVELEKSLEVAVKSSREVFERLPPSGKRDGVLGFLGRLKRPSLKEKIRHRSKLVTSRIGDSIPDIDSVTDAAVDLRNMCVHGSISSGVSKKLQGPAMVFLTDTLEFVFCASDLVESGWDIGAWHREQQGGTGGHPFAVYLHSYLENSAVFRMEPSESR